MTRTTTRLSSFRDAKKDTPAKIEKSSPKPNFKDPKPIVTFPEELKPFKASRRVKWMKIEEIVEEEEENMEEDSDQENVLPGRCKLDVKGNAVTVTHVKHGQVFIGTRRKFENQENPLYFCDKCCMAFHEKADLVSHYEKCGDSCIN